ncbi:MAG: YfhO family protein [Bacteroidota bacterium]|nr:YfhO family protein [Bacteroidota bacterium]
MNKISIKNFQFQALAPHISAVVIFLILTLAFLSPILEGKKLRQHDTIQFRGMSKEISDFREKTGEEPLWTNSMFGGMPTYLISVHFKSNLFKYIDKYLSLGLKAPAKYVFLSFLGFYFLLVFGFKMNPWLGIIGAIAFGFSSYFFIISAAGHNTKAHALTYMAPILAGIIIAFNGRILWGSVVTGIAMALQISASHPQMTYYTLLTILVFGLVFLFRAFKEKSLVLYFKTVGVLSLAVILAVGVNFTSLWLTYEYGKVSIRGESELSSNQVNKTTGLDKDYILNDYSYGIDETLNLMIPNFKGGASSGFDLKSETYKELRRNNVPNAKQIAEQSPLAYWGNQRLVSGPVYIGAVVVFLFFFGLIFVKGSYKWWLLSATLLSFMLAWGKNFMFLSDFFINYFPGYNKFRAVSMTLVIAEITIPLLAMLAIKKLLEGNYKKEEGFQALKYSFIIIGGVSLFFALFPGLFYNFSAPVDEQLIASGWPAQFIQAIHLDRKHLLQTDSFRSFMFILFSSGVLFAYMKGWLKSSYVILALGLLFLVDLWPVDKRYLNNDSFESPRVINNTFLPNAANQEILLDKDPDFRVMNLTVSTFNDATTSYFHKSIGGYHGAKMRRYQELISHHISQNNMEVVNMLNTKYFILAGQNNQPLARHNPDALGHAWFVEKFHIVENADSEIAALNEIKPRHEAVIDQRFIEHVEGLNLQTDSLASIRLRSYAPNYLVYESNSSIEQLAVFSEIFYNKGWKAYIDEVETPHFRVNYVLRGLRLPPGEHKIEFKFHPKAYYTGEKISLGSSLLLLILLIMLSIKSIKQK